MATTTKTGTVLDNDVTLTAGAAIMILALMAARRLAERLTYRLDRLVAACAAFDAAASS